MAKRKMVRERKRFYDFYEGFDGYLVDVIASLQNELEEYGQDARLESEYTSCFGDDYHEWYIVYEREETDAEMNKRLKAAEKAKQKRAKDKAAKEEKERKELARLKEKYGEG